MTAMRLLISALGAAGVTIALLLFMSVLVSSGQEERVHLDAIEGIHFGPLDIPDEISSKSRRKPPKPPPPPVMPPSPSMPEPSVEPSPQNLPRMNFPDLEMPPAGGEGLFIGNLQQVGQAAEGDIIPVVVIRPMYPREAAMSGTEGWVKVEFIITQTGEVKDARVIESNPPQIFNREAIRAILKWKFKPRIVGGVAVERRATQVIDFKLGDS